MTGVSVYNDMGDYILIAVVHATNVIRSHHVTTNSGNVWPDVMTLYYDCGLSYTIHHNLRTNSHLK